MKIKYKVYKYPLPHRKIIDVEYCCNKMKAHQESDIAYIQPVFLEGIVDECPWCNKKIELQEVT